MTNITQNLVYLLHLRSKNCEVAYEILFMQGFLTIRRVHPQFFVI